MTRLLKSVVVVTLVALSSCSASQRSRWHPIEEMLEVNVTEIGGAVELTWKFTNHYNAPVWVPVGWGTCIPPFKLPFGFVVPHGELLFIFGEIVPCKEQRLDKLSEVHPAVDTRRLAPGESWSGRIWLEVPYKVQGIIKTPWQYKGPDNFTVREITVSEVSAIQVAVQYYLFDPLRSHHPSRNALEQKGYARTLATGIIMGQKTAAAANNRARANWRVSISERIPVSVPLKSPIKLYVYTPSPLSEEELEWYKQRPPKESVFDKGVEE